MVGDYNLHPLSDPPLKVWGLGDDKGRRRDRGKRDRDRDRIRQEDRIDRCEKLCWDKL